jgi:UDP-glucuronate 4-epimerase
VHVLIGQCYILHCVACVQVYNLGNTHPHTVSEMVALLEKHLGRRAVRKYIPVPPTGDVLATFADISAARKVRAHTLIRIV